jgi:hypothetical protein
MKVFEFHFNDQQKSKNVFDSFVFQPENETQEDLGTIMIAGQINNAFDKSQELLKNLCQLIKQEHYNTPDISPKIAFKRALVKANLFLKEKINEGDATWVGNFNFAAVNITGELINFVKVGNMKILLVREKEVYDISDNLEYQGSDTVGSYFLNVAIGKLGPEDKLIITNNDFFQKAQDENILKKVIESQDWSQKELSNIFKNSKKELKDTKGMALLVTNKINDAKRPKTNLIFSFPKINLPKITIPNMEMPNFSLKTIAIFTVIVLVIAGGVFAIFKFGFNNSTQTASVTQEQQQQGQETQIPTTEAPVLPEPQIPAFFNMGDVSYSPTKIVVGNEALLMFNNTTEYYKLNTKDLKVVKDVSQYPLEMLTLADKSIFFFSPTSTIAEYDLTKDVLGYQQMKLSEGLQINDLVFYNDKLYFLDSASGTILKKSKDKMEESLKDEKLVNARSFAIDGNIWVLADSTRIDKYFSGKFVESITIPSAVDAKKIWTQRGSDFIYVLDTQGNQVIVMDKKGTLVKAHQDPAWRNMKDFAVSSKGIIYLIDNQKIYELQ